MDITPAVITAFRADFAGFADTQAWPDATVERALQRADKETGSSRWGGYSDFSLKQRGMFNFAAHALTVSKAQADATAAGGVPGASAQVQSKSVGDESVTYAVAAAQNGASGDEGLKATAYGQEFVRLRKRAAAGAAHSNQVAVG